MRTLAIAVFALSLVGCKTVSPVVTVTCLPMADYTPAQEQAVAEEILALPPEDADLILMFNDYAVLRAADRACEASNPGVLK